jgi:hypothetical protein
VKIPKGQNPQSLNPKEWKSWTYNTGKNDFAKFFKKIFFTVNGIYLRNIKTQEIPSWTTLYNEIITHIFLQTGTLRSNRYLKSAFAENHWPLTWAHKLTVSRIEAKHPHLILYLYSLLWATPAVFLQPSWNPGNDYQDL